MAWYGSEPSTTWLSVLAFLLGVNCAVPYGLTLVNGIGHSLGVLAAAAGEGRASWSGQLVEMSWQESLLGLLRGALV